LHLKKNLGIVEKKNQSIGINLKEVELGKRYKNWIDILDEVVDDINKVSKPEKQISDLEIHVSY